MTTRFATRTWPRVPRAARAATLAALIELVAGAAISLVILAVRVGSAETQPGVVVSANGIPGPFVVSVLLTAGLVLIQIGVALAMWWRNALTRILGIIVALLIALTCALLVVGVAVQIAISGLAPKNSDVYDWIFGVGAFVPSAAVFVLNARAAFFAAVDTYTQGA